MERSIEIREICTNLRPAKVAVLIHKGHGWQEKCLKIIEMFSQTWGGSKSFIIPTDGKMIDEYFWFLLKKFDPDYFYVYNDIEGEFKDVSEELKDEILDKLNPFYESRVGKDPIQLYYFQCDWPLTFIPDIFPNTDFDEKIDEDIIYDPIINYHIADSPIYVKLIVHSVLGKLEKDYSEKLTDLRISIRKKDLSEYDISTILKNIWDEENHKYPFNYSMMKLESYTRSRDLSKIKNSALVVVIGDSLNDFCLYYNLSTLRYDVYYAPYSIIRSSNKNSEKNRKKSSSKLDSFNFYLGSYLSKKIDYGNSDRQIIFTSISKNTIDLENIKEIIQEYLNLIYKKKDRDVILISKEINKLLPYHYRVMEYDNYSNCYREQFIDSKSINQIKTPIPRNFIHRSFDKHYWITEVNIENYMLPPFRTLSSSIEARLYSNHEIRISNYGFAYFCPFIGYMGESIDKYLVKPYINLLSSFEIAKKIFNESGYRIRTSDKGNYERETIEKFGSLKIASEYLMIDKYQKLLSIFVKKENPDTPEDGIFLKDDSRMYLSLKSIKNILGDETNVITEFIEKGILHRGFIFKCDKCKFTGWYDIEDVDNKFKCRRCRKIQYYKSKHLARQNPVEPEWFYKLDEAVYQGYDNDMIVPILTINKLKELSESSFLYTNEIEIIKRDDEEESREIDLFCISDGKIIIGECKRENRLRKKEIRKYKKIYKEIMAEKLIFCTFNEKGWSNGTLDKLEDILGDKINYELFKLEDLISL